MAASAGNPSTDGLHLLAALVQQDGGTAAPLLRAVGADPAGLLKTVQDQLARMPQAAGATVSAPETSRQLLAALATASKLAQRDVGRVRLDRAPAGGPGHRRRPGGHAAARGRRRPEAADRRVRAGPRPRAGDVAGSGGYLSGAGEVRHRPHPERPRREARPGHRPGRGDPPGDPGAVPADQEQPGADRRARRRQDRGRRGPSPAHGGRRRARVAARQARRRPRPRRDGGRAPSTAASSRSG